MMLVYMEKLGIEPRTFSTQQEAVKLDAKKMSYH
jgi:hypothetical protein